MKTLKTFEPEKLLERIEDIEEIRKLPFDYLKEKTVLGIDLYEYSKYPLVEQIYVPVIFNKLYEAAANNASVRESFIFSSYGSNGDDFKKNFISTGDGGFQIFDNPLQAVLFAIYFQSNVKRFISGGSPDAILKKLHKIVQNIELRYAITHDHIYSYNNNFFGPAIISNARILYRDNLNRLLVDHNSINWFTETINSIENLMDMNKKNFLLTNFFKHYDPNLESSLFEKKGAFKSVDLLKIGNIDIKTTSLDIYNLHIQTLLKLNIVKHDYKMYLLTLGNLNTKGIE
jgi:hypothetical protein